MRLARVAIETGRDDPDALWMAGWTLSGFTTELTTAANVIDRALTSIPIPPMPGWPAGSYRSFKTGPIRRSNQSNGRSG